VSRGLIVKVYTIILHDSVRTLKAYHDVKCQVKIFASGSKDTKIFTSRSNGESPESKLFE